MGKFHYFMECLLYVSERCDVQSTIKLVAYLIFLFWKKTPEYHLRLYEEINFSSIKSNSLAVGTAGLLCWPLLPRSANMSSDSIAMLRKAGLREDLAGLAEQHLQHE